MHDYLVCGKTIVRRPENKPPYVARCDKYKNHDNPTYHPRTRTHNDSSSGEQWSVWLPVRLEGTGGRWVTAHAGPGQLTQAFCPACNYPVLRAGNYICGNYTAKCGWRMPLPQEKLVDAQLSWQLTGMWYPVGLTSGVTYPPDLEDPKYSDFSLLKALDSTPYKRK